MPEEVMYKRGQSSVDKKIEPILQSILADDMQVALAKQSELLEKIDQHWERTEFEGLLDTRTLNVTDREQVLDLMQDHIVKPWISASFINQGPDTAYIILNTEGIWIPLFRGVPFEPNYSGSDQRVRMIRYKCDPGNTATVVAIGKY
jgi:hypothetical protein